MAEDPQIIIDQLNTLSETVKKLHSETQKRDWISYVPIATAALTFLVAVFSGYINYRISDLERQQKETETRLSREQANANLSLSIVHELLNVIGEEKENEKKKTAMANLLDSLDNLYREEAGQEQIRQFIVKLESLLQGPAAAFAQDNASIPIRSSGDLRIAPSPGPGPSSPSGTNVVTQANGTLVSEGNPKGWDYDIFWCEGQAKAQSVAQMIFDAIIKRDSASLGLIGRVRLRTLPQDVNQRPEYNIHNRIVIKRHMAKWEQAEKLQSYVNKVLSGQSRQAEVEDSSFKLPWYLSLFVCTDA